jgi:hypothetical protein
MTIYLIKYYSDPYEPAGTIYAASTEELAQAFLEYMKTVDTNARDWFIESIEVDSKYKGRVHNYNVYFWENSLDRIDVSGGDYIVDFPERVEQWGGHINPNTKSAIVYVKAYSIEEAKAIALPRYEEWVKTR